MARPATQRRIPARIDDRVFKPRGVPLADLETVELTLDGLEAIRLADREGLYQEEAARRMGVSRPTFARILTQARRKVAEALVEGKSLVISGGAVTRRPSEAWPCPVHGHRRRRGRGCRCDAEAVPERERERERGRGRGRGRGRRCAEGS